MIIYSPNETVSKHTFSCFFFFKYIFFLSYLDCFLLFDRTSRTHTHKHGYGNQMKSIDRKNFFCLHFVFFYLHWYIWPSTLISFTRLLILFKIQITITSKFAFKNDVVSKWIHIYIYKEREREKEENILLEF